MNININGKKHDECHIDAEMIRNALAEIKNNPNIETVASFDEYGNYSISKIIKKRDSFLSRLKVGSILPSKNKDPYQPNREYYTYRQDSETQR